MIGNSHLANLRTAWKSAPLETIKATFFGAVNEHLEHLHISDGLLVAVSPELKHHFVLTAGVTTIDPTAFDAFVFSGFSFGFHRIAWIYKLHRLIRHATDSTHPVSLAALEAAIYERLDASPPSHVVRLIRSVFDGPVLACLTPHLSAALTSLPLEDEDRRFVQSDEADFAGELESLHQSAIDKLALRYGLTVLHQPEGTIERLVYTKSDYGVGVSPTGLPDHSHANAQYGRLVLDQIEARLAADPTAIAWRKARQQRA